MNLKFDRTPQGFRVTLELNDNIPEELLMTKKSFLIFVRPSESIESIVKQFNQLLKKVK